MQMKRLVTLCAVLGLVAACASERSAVRDTPPSEPEAESSGPGPTLCADLATLVDAARQNFPGLRREDRPVTVDHAPGFEATFQLANTIGCRILTSEAPYPDVYECDLAPLASHASHEAAREMVWRWGAVVSACPVVASWRALPSTKQGYGWELEIEGNHELAVRVITTGADDARPTLVVRMNEI